MLNHASVDALFPLAANCWNGSVKLCFSDDVWVWASVYSDFFYEFFSAGEFELVMPTFHLNMHMLDNNDLSS